MKKILAILLAALLLIGVFAGCAKQEAKTPVQPEQSTPAETTPEAKTDEAPVERMMHYATERGYRETERRTYQAMEAFIHNLNTMHSRAGAQTPFSSIN